MKARFFYAPAIFSVLPKLFVLTEDLILYSELRDLTVVDIETNEVQSFHHFNQKDFETEEYPILLEVNATEAIDISNSTTYPWLNRYLSGKNIFKAKSQQA